MNWMSSRREDPDDTRRKHDAIEDQSFSDVDNGSIHYIHKISVENHWTTNSEIVKNDAKQLR